MDILLEWVSADEKELSALDIAHTAHSDRPALLSLLSMTTASHIAPSDYDDSRLTRSAYPVQFAWLLSRRIRLQREFLRPKEAAALIPLLTAGCLPHVEVMTFMDDDDDEEDDSGVDDDSDDSDGEDLPPPPAAGKAAVETVVPAELLKVLLAACPHLLELQVRCAIDNVVSNIHRQYP